MTHDEYNDGIDRAERWFRALPNIADEAVEQLIVEGFLSYTDLTFLDGAGLAEIIGCEEDVADEMIACAEEWAEAADEEARKEQEELQKQREATRQQQRMTMAGPAGEDASPEAKAAFENLFKGDEGNAEAETETPDEAPAAEPEPVAETVVEAEAAETEPATEPAETAAE